MIDVRFHYLARPGRLKMMQARFESTYGQTLALLERELKHLNARQVTIRAGFKQVRNDGWPYSSARPDHPAVILEFLDRRGGMLAFRGLRYRTFEANLRAIALTLEHLRAVDRYEVTTAGEQYAGFKALPAVPTAQEKWTRERAAAWLAGVSSVAADSILDGSQAQNAYRSAVKRLHPDNQTTGNSDQFLVLTGEIRGVLGL